jgi:hypothetical protein
MSPPVALTLLPLLPRCLVISGGGAGEVERRAEGMKLPTEMGWETGRPDWDGGGNVVADRAREVLQHCWFAVGSGSGVSNESRSIEWNPGDMDQCNGNKRKRRTLEWDYSVRSSD